MDRLGYEDLLAATLPDRDVPELIDGALHYKASPRAKHSYLHGSLGRALAPWSVDQRGRRGWWILMGPDVRFSDRRVLRPDLAGWRASRLLELPDGPVDMAPDWVCEILSPGHLRHDRVTKMNVYAEEQVPFVWLVSAEDRVLEAYERREQPWLRIGAYTDGDVIALPPFDDQPLDVGALMPPLTLHDGEAPPYPGA